MELSIDHESRAIILWLSSGRTLNLEPLYRKGKELKYRVIVIRSGFGDLFSDTSALLWFNRTSFQGNHSHGCPLAAALH
ncbi:MAG: hypothetical protein IJ418_12000 [Clostridia bacterium]|nr:hypothetical protein [Clostridia bacterium]